MYQPMIRLLVLVVLVINQLIITLGYEPFPVSEEQLYEFFSTVVLGIVAFWTYWKNNSWTKEAQEADAILLEKKLAKKRGVK